jgi:hypothetical protein
VSAITGIESMTRTKESQRAQLLKASARDRRGRSSSLRRRYPSFLLVKGGVSVDLELPIDFIAGFFVRFIPR